MHLAVIIGIILIIVILAYAIFIWWAYVNQRFIFSPYTPNLGPGLFQPGGPVLELTPEQIKCRQFALGATDADGNPLVPVDPGNCEAISPYKSN
jgi:hypothetical protein